MTDDRGGPEQVADPVVSGWEEHRRRQRGLWLRSTPAQRLAWLEEAIQLAGRSGALPRATSAPHTTGDQPEDGSSKINPRGTVLVTVLVALLGIIPIGVFSVAGFAFGTWSLRAPRPVRGRGPAVVAMVFSVLGMGWSAYFLTALFGFSQCGVIPGASGAWLCTSGSAWILILVGLFFVELVVGLAVGLWANPRRA